MFWGTTIARKSTRPEPRPPRPARARRGPVDASRAAVSAPDPVALAALAGAALVDKKALDPVVLDLRPITLVADFFVIGSGRSDVHRRAIADGLIEAFASRGLRPVGVEGYSDARWILVDFGDVVAHIFAPEEREFYDLERLWGDAPRRDAADFAND